MDNSVSAPKPVVLVILDGFGIAPQKDLESDATLLASMPNYHKLWLNNPHTHLQASGKSVGLPDAQDGSSQVGHLNIGAGRVVYQDLQRINQSIIDGTFIRNEAFVKAVEHVNRNDSALHLVGIIQPSAVHASTDHLNSLLWLAKEYDVKRVFLHVFTDGRDDPPHEGITFVVEVENRMKETGVGKIATITGRYYAMDRDNRWDRTEVCYNCLTQGTGIKEKDAQKALIHSYEQGITDEFIKPINIVDENNNPIGLIHDNDAVIFFNHRVDRPRQLTKAFVLPNFEYVEVRKDIFKEELPLKKRVQIHKITTFSRPNFIQNLFFVTMTQYEEGLPVSAIAFPRRSIKQTISEVLSDHQKRQLHISETEKERFVTYYFNGLREDPFPGEDRIIIPSPSIPTYDLKPEMSSFELTDVLVQKIKQNIYDFIVINFANPDMVGHTGKIAAGIKACGAIDICLGKLAPVVKGMGGVMIVTADHGNVEEMFNRELNEPDTEHSNFPVPFIYIGPVPTGLKTLQPGILGDVAPTILKVMGLPIPQEMTGRILIR